MVLDEDGVRQAGEKIDIWHLPHRHLQDLQRAHLIAFQELVIIVRYQNKRDGDANEILDPVQVLHAEQRVPQAQQIREQERLREERAEPFDGEEARLDVQLVHQVLVQDGVLHVQERHHARHLG